MRKNFMRKAIFSTLSLLLLGLIFSAPVYSQTWVITGGTTPIGAGEGQWLGVGNKGGAQIGSTTVLASANQVEVWQFFQTNQLTFSKLVFRVQTGAATNCAVGLYNSTGTLVFSSGAVDCTASNSTKTITLSSQVTISPGRYYIAYTADNTTAVIFGWTTGGSNAIVSSMENVTTNHNGICANASVAGVLPTSCGTISSLTSSIFAAMWVE